jgi:hypothetical protein
VQVQTAVASVKTVGAFLGILALIFGGATYVASNYVVRPELAQIKQELKGDIKDNTTRLEANLKENTTRLEANLTRVEANLKANTTRLEANLTRVEANLKDNTTSLEANFKDSAARIERVMSLLLLLIGGGVVALGVNVFHLYRPGHGDVGERNPTKQGRGR